MNKSGTLVLQLFVVALFVLHLAGCFLCAPRGICLLFGAGVFFGSRIRGSNPWAGGERHHEAQESKAPHKLTFLIRL